MILEVDAYNKRDKTGAAPVLCTIQSVIGKERVHENYESVGFVFVFVFFE